jgi:hypothetical protein
MSTIDENLHDLSLDSLADQCGQQTSRFYQGRESDTRYCFEIFRRAIIEADQLAWGLIPQLYGDQVARWVRRHPAFHSTGEDEDFFINCALEKLWQAVPAGRFGHFPDLRHLLSYLQLCVYSVITDHVRAGVQAALELDFEQVEATAAPEEPLEDQVADRCGALELWNMVADRLRDSKEVEVAYEAFVLDIKPADIWERHPERYKSAKEIYRIKENIVDRLRRDHELLSELGFLPES